MARAPGTGLVLGHQRQSGKVGSAQRGHQLGPQGHPNPRAVPQSVSALQPRTRTPVAQKHRPWWAQAPEAARNVPALVGTRAGVLEALVNV